MVKSLRRRWRLNLKKGENGWEAEYREPTHEEKISDSFASAKDLAKEWVEGGLMWFDDLIYDAQQDALKKTLKYLRRKGLMKPLPEVVKQKIKKVKKHEGHS